MAADLLHPKPYTLNPKLRGGKACEVCSCVALGAATCRATAAMILLDDTCNF